ncbi:hypothetical protein BC826DRAFT_972126 [Russula brevipes]|nr:hypothetical protein BC826DRAFT_972126 [Russula brevipes]
MDPTHTSNTTTPAQQMSNATGATPAQSKRGRKKRSRSQAIDDLNEPDPKRPAPPPTPTTTTTPNQITPLRILPQSDTTPAHPNSTPRPATAQPPWSMQSPAPPASPSPVGNTPHLRQIGRESDEPTDWDTPMILDSNPQMQTTQRADPRPLGDRFLDLDVDARDGAGQGDHTHEELGKFMRLSPEDMHPIHDAFPMAFLKGTEIRQLNEWGDHKSRKLFAVLFDGAARTLDGQNTTLITLQSTLFKLTKSPNIMVAAPRPVNTSNKTNLPLTFMIYDLEEDGYNLLKDTPIWCSDDITFRTIPFHPPNPDFLFSIRGLNTLLDSAVYDLVNQTWHDEHTAQYLDQISEGWDIAERRANEGAITNFIESMKIKRVDIKIQGNTLSPRFSVLTDGASIPDNRLWLKLRQYFFSRTYALPMQSNGTNSLSPYSCGICHSVDHPRGLCPFPNIAGWRGPVHRPVQEAAGHLNSGRPAMRNYRP